MNTTKNFLFDIIYLTIKFVIANRRNTRHSNSFWGPLNTLLEAPLSQTVLHDPFTCINLVHRNWCLGKGNIVSNRFFNHCLFYCTTVWLTFFSTAVYQNHLVPIDSTIPNIWHQTFIKRNQKLVYLDLLAWTTLWIKRAPKLITFSLNVVYSSLDCEMQKESNSWYCCLYWFTLDNITLRHFLKCFYRITPNLVKSRSKTNPNQQKQKDTFT